jgi:CheY-like chemotaxis protein
VPHILLVEDNPIDATLIHRLFGKLAAWPITVTWIDDGRKALWYLRSLEEGGVAERPDFVLLDVHLPKVDGLEVLAAFRASLTTADMPVFLLSSTPADQIAALAATYRVRPDLYFEKPTNLQKFKDMALTIREYVEQRVVRASPLAIGNSGSALVEWQER